MSKLNHRRSRTVSAAILSTSMLFFLGCGNDNTEDAERSIAEIAAGDPNFSTLVSALDQAGLVEVLAGAGTYTVFAPDNDAFAAAGITDVSAVPVADLTRILLYHVLGQKVMSAAIPAAANTLSENAYGNPLTLVFSTSAGVQVNNASVTAADIEASNGVIHAVDAVIFPPNVVEMAGIAGFNTLVAAVTDAADLPGDVSLVEALAADAPFTVFAPTDAAFDEITVPSDTAVLRDVLLLHVLNTGAPVLSGDIPATPVDTLLDGEQLTFDASAPSVSSGGTASAALGPVDINVTNGVIHVIDAVLLPTP